MAQTLTRAASRHLTFSFFIPKRLLSTTSITRPPPIPSLLFSRRALAPLSHAVRSLPLGPTHFTSIRCRVNRSGNSAYSPLNSGSNFSDRPPTEMAPLFPGCDYQHWLIVMDKPGGEGATKEQMIDCYIQTLAKVVGSEEEAKKKIYNVSCERYFGFGCELDEETSNKLEGLPGVLFVLPDSYVDPENKDYGAELFVNGEIVQRSPERQKRVEPQAQRANDRPRYNDRTRYVRRRENMRQGSSLYYLTRLVSAFVYLRFRPTPLFLKDDFNVNKSDRHRHGKDFSPGSKKHRQEELDKRSSHKKEENVSRRKDDISKQKIMENRESRKKLKSEVSKDVVVKDESKYEKQLYMKRKNERPAGSPEDLDAKRRSKDLAEKYRHASRIEEKYERDSKRKHQTTYDEEHRGRDTTKKHDTRKGHASEIVDRKEKKESMRSHHEVSHHKRRRSQSREREREGRHRRSVSLSPRRVQKHASHHQSEHHSFSHGPKERLGRQHSDERGKLTSNGSSGHHRQHGGSTSGLGGYSPRKRKTEVTVRTPSPAHRSTEKRTAKWDLAPAEAEKMVFGSVPSNLQASSQTVSLNMHAVLGAVPGVSVTGKHPVVASTSSFLLKHNVSFDSVQLTEATRPMRRLYVENLPASVSEKDITEYFNNRLLSSSVNHIPRAQPCISCIIHKGKGQALVEFLTPEDASAALSFDGSTFFGPILKIRRPKDFLVEIANAFGPLKTCHFEINEDHSEQYATLEYVDQSVTLKACAGLNGMKLGGQVITAVQAVPDASSLGNDVDLQSCVIPQLARPLLQKATQVLKLKNLFPEDFSSLSEAEVEEVLEDVRLECARFGTIKSVNVVKHPNTIISTGDNKRDHNMETGARQNLDNDEIKLEAEKMEEVNDGNAGGTAGVKFTSESHEVITGNDVNDEKPVGNLVDNVLHREDEFEVTVNSEDINRESLDAELCQQRLDGNSDSGAHLDTDMTVKDLALETAVMTVSQEVPNLMNTSKEESDHHSDSDRNADNIQSIDKAVEENPNLEGANGKLPEDCPNTEEAVIDPASMIVSTTISQEIPMPLNTPKEELDFQDDLVTDNIQDEITNVKKKSVSKEDSEPEEVRGKLPEVVDGSAGSSGMESETIEKDENGKKNNLQKIFEPGCVFVEYRRVEASCMAAHCLHGRLFDDRTVTVEYIDPDLYRVKFPK
ncbi:hypothetical protein CCACVL1_05456 [Corchorus capsularis]|uniref:RRM domain-containing protein n=1 Tax=Corchorus capsularis TaxID=210143 RepID=A0A1R3JKD2_COCAP|nr:hypothetical protein CCACVL1_05456 [Corchorus capsularis]